MEDTELIACEHCNRLVDREEIETIYHTSGTKHELCEACRNDEEIVRQCSGCDEIYYDPFMRGLPRQCVQYETWITYYSDIDRYLCRDCRNANYSICDWCNALNHNDNLRTDGYIHLCEDCLDNAYTCESCGCFVHQDNICIRGDFYFCEACYPGDNDDPEEYYTPVRFHTLEAGEVRKSFDPILCGPYMGLEIEYDNCRKERDIYQDLYDLLSGYGTLKTDGSLSDGMELNLPPGNLDYWAGPGRTKLNRILDLVNSDCQLWKAKTAGIHVHRDRAGTDVMTEAGLIYLFWACREPLSKLAGRHWESPTVQRYASYVKHYVRAGDLPLKKFVLEENGHKKNISRYCAINCLPGETIEFRPFQSTGRTDSVMGYLALVDLSTDYSNKAGIDHMINNNNNGWLWEDFKNFARNGYSGPLQGAILQHIDYKGV